MAEDLTSLVCADALATARSTVWKFLAYHATATQIYVPADCSASLIGLQNDRPHVKVRITRCIVYSECSVKTKVRTVRMCFVLWFWAELGESRRPGEKNNSQIVCANFPLAVTERGIGLAFVQDSEVTAGLL